MGGEQYEFEEIVSILPEGWQAKAKELGALRRAREIKTAEDLLKVILLYSTAGKSFGTTAALLSLTGSYKLNKTAVYKRIANSGRWLNWLCENLMRRGKNLAQKPEWLRGKEVFLVDATVEPVFGNKEKVYVLHYAINLFSLVMKEMLLAGKSGDEKLKNFTKFKKDDVAIGDRAYGTIQNIEIMREQGCGFVLRLKTKAFKMYNREGLEIEVPQLFKRLEAGEAGSVEVYYQYKDEKKKVRLCA